MHVSKVIEQLGYKREEARVYLAALSLGECVVSDIATKVNLPRTSVQLIVEKLHASGLMNFYVKKRYKYWTAENPEKLLINLKEKEAALRAVLPEMTALRSEAGGKPTIKVFSGLDDIKLIYEDILATKHHIVGIVPWDEWIALLGVEFMEDFIKTRAEHFLGMKLLTPKTPVSLGLRERDDKELRITRFLPKRFDIRDTFFIYGDKVAIISLNKKQPTGILIDDPETRHTMNVFFEEIWNQVTE